MTGEIINFRKAKKAADRIAKEKTAAENRVKFGRSKADRQRLDAEEEIKRKRIDQHLIEAGATAKPRAEDETS